MAYNVQQQVDAYETMGLGALQSMQQKNPKLLVGIALENLQKDMQEQQRAKQMASGAVGPTVIDKKLMGLAGAGVGLGQQQAMATAAPGLQMRGQQMQAAQMRKAMAPQPQPIRMAGGGVVGYEVGGKVNMDSLLDALMIAESGGDPRAVSSAGAEGAYQIMPSTAAQPGFGVQPMEGSRFDPEASRKFARQYLQAMIDRYNGDIEAALVAYNAGPGNADKFVAAGKDYRVLPLAMQTQPYVEKIMGQLEREDRRRDIQLGGGRTISTTAPESYTERMRRQSADRVRAMETASMPPRPPAETEIYQPNIPDALIVARAQQELREPGSTSDKYTPEERAAGGIGYLNYLARKQQEKKDEAGRAARYLGMMQNQEDMISRANPATNLSGVDLRQDFSTERSMKSPAQRMEEAFPGAREAAGRYALDKAAGLAALSDYAPEIARSNNPLVNLRSDLGEIGSYLQRVLGFQEGGQVKSFQEGDLVEADGEQVIPLSSVTDDPNVFEQGLQLIKDNPVEAASLGLMFVPGIGPALGMGARGLMGLRALAPRAVSAASKGLGALRSRVPNVSRFFTKERQYTPNFRMEDPTLLTKSGRPTVLRGRSGFEAATSPRAAVERIPGAPRTRRGRRVGGRNPDIRRASPARGPLLSPRVFSPGRTSQTLGGLGLAGSGIASLVNGGDEVEVAARQPTPQEMLGSAVFQREDAPPAMFRAGDTNTQRRQDSRGGGGGQGIASRLGSALTSDKAQQLYSAFQDLGLAGGASRGFEGAQLISALTQRDLAQQEAAARERALDIDEQQMQLTKDVAQTELIENLINSPSFDIVRQGIAEEMDLPIDSSEVLNETLKRLMGAISGVSGFGSVVEDARRIIQ